MYTFVFFRELSLISFLLLYYVTEHVYCTETRPYNQGARLTAYELVHDRIPATLICDSAVSALMKTKSIAAVIVGADRVSANGDTANKIGTYQVSERTNNNYKKLLFGQIIQKVTISSSVDRFKSYALQVYYCTRNSHWEKIEHFFCEELRKLKLFQFCRHIDVSMQLKRSACL